jgi:hypothetical protein
VKIEKNIPMILGKKIVVWEKNYCRGPNHCELVFDIPIGI